MSTQMPEFWTHIVDDRSNIKAKMKTIPTATITPSLREGRDKLYIILKNYVTIDLDGVKTDLKTGSMVHVARGKHHHFINNINVWPCKYIEIYYDN